MFYPLGKNSEKPREGGGGVEWHPHLLVLQKVKKLFDKVYLASACWRENLIKLLFGLIQLFVSMRPKFEV